MTANHGARRALVALLAGLAITGCAGQGDKPAKAAEAESTPPDHTIQVAIADELPATVYFNKDDSVCTISDFFTEGEPVSITITSGDGEVLGASEAPREGGEWQNGAGCLVYVEIVVPGSDFYEVTLSGGTSPINESQTVEHSSQEPQGVEFHV